MNPVFHDMVTASGHTGDLMLSALQKFIRRGETERAARAAYELSICSEEAEKVVWRRLRVICAEDVGLANPQAPSVVHALAESACELPWGTPDRNILLTHAVRYLCQCPKDRASCTLNSVIKRRVKAGAPFELPDYVYDMHTIKGRAMGRGRMHFLHEASRVIPPSERCDPWYAELESLYKEEDPNA